MKNRWNQFKQWTNEHEDAMFAVGVTAITTGVSLMVGRKIARSHDVMCVSQLLNGEETVGMLVHLRNGTTRPFCTLAGSFSKEGA